MKRVWLEQKYLIEKMGCPQIAKIVGVSRSTVLRWVTEFNIPRRSNKEAQELLHCDKIYHNRDWLYQKYVTEKLCLWAMQALGTLYIAKNGRKMKGGVYEMPNEIDVQVANLKLASLGLSIDTLTKEQKKYSCSWDIGT